MTQKNKIKLINDIKSALISEMISYDFYSKSSTSVKLISGMHAFQDMMWEEEKHVKILKEEYIRLGGTEKINYDPQEYGGLAMPNLDVDAVTALDVAMKEERESIEMFNGFLKKHKKSESAKIFKQLLNDEKKHLEQWNLVSKSIVSASGKYNGANDEVYRFSKDDLEVIKIALSAENAAYKFYNKAMNKIETIDGTHAFQNMAWEEEKHVKRLEDEYYRLLNKKPSPENLVQNSPLMSLKKESDSLVALELSIKEERASLKRFLELEERCTNTRLKKVIGELLESEWDHFSQWRNTYKAIKEKNIPL